MEKALALLQEGKPVRVMLAGIAAEDLQILQRPQSPDLQAVLYVCNVAEGDAATGNEHTRSVETMAAAQGASAVHDLGSHRGRGCAHFRRPMP